MKRVIRANTYNYENLLHNCTTYTQKDLLGGFNTLRQLEQDYEDGTIDDLDEALQSRIFDEDDWILDAAVLLTTIEYALGCGAPDVKMVRISEDGDFFAATLPNGQIKYFFDRGPFSQGVKDADTGEIYHYSY